MTEYRYDEILNEINGADALEQSIHTLIENLMADVQEHIDEDECICFADFLKAKILEEI